MVLDLVEYAHQAIFFLQVYHLYPNRDIFYSMICQDCADANVHHLHPTELLRLFFCFYTVDVVQFYLSKIQAFFSQSEPSGLELGSLISGPFGHSSNLYHCHYYQVQSDKIHPLDLHKSEVKYL